MAKDNLEKETEPELNMKADLADAYLHPIFHSFEEEFSSEEKDGDRHREEEIPKVKVDKHEVYHSSSPSSHYASAYEQSSSQYEYHYDAHQYEQHEYRYN